MLCLSLEVQRRSRSRDSDVGELIRAETSGPGKGLASFRSVEGSLPGLWMSTGQSDGADDMMVLIGGEGDGDDWSQPLRKLIEEGDESEDVVGRRGILVSV